ncbi:ATP-grasp domain-containing protein [Vibrio profundum]|uniref:ATP-grasp domain-containing protein n=1 Tax=Vibrio profundum TaxID=2910247 RepID=UPI003D11114F
MSRTILLVNPAPSNEYLSTELRKLGCRSIALLSRSLNQNKSLPIGKSCFDRDIRAIDMTPDECLALIDEPIDYVLNGTEDSIPLSDYLASKLTPQYQNNADTQHKRGTKYGQQNALKEAGLKAIEQIKIACTDINIAFASNLIYPLFAKPVLGAGSEGAFKAESSVELIRKLKNAPSSGIYGLNDMYLLQEYITGEEYCIDSFSCNGEVYFSGVFKYRRDRSTDVPIYESVDMVTDAILCKKIKAYIRDVLNACDVRNGFAHTEIFQLNDGSFRTVEINPRVAGFSGSTNIMSSIMGIASQPDLLANELNGTLDNLPSDTSLEGFGSILVLYHESEWIKTHPNLVKYIELHPTLPQSLAEISLISAKAMALISDKSIGVPASEITAFSICDRQKLVARFQSEGKVASTLEEASYE